MAGKKSNFQIHLERWYYQTLNQCVWGRVRVFENCGLIMSHYEQENFKGFSILDVFRYCKLLSYLENPRYYCFSLPKKSILLSPLPKFPKEVIEWKINFTFRSWNVSFSEWLNWSLEKFCRLHCKSKFVGKRTVLCVLNFDNK